MGRRKIFSVGWNASRFPPSLFLRSCRIKWFDLFTGEEEEKIWFFDLSVYKCSHIPSPSNPSFNVFLLLFSPPPTEPLTRESTHSEKKKGGNKRNSNFWRRNNNKKMRFFGLGRRKP
jgi:hypothetical protein